MPCFRVVHGRYFVRIGPRRCPNATAREVRSIKPSTSSWQDRFLYRLKRLSGIGVSPDFLIIGGQKCGTTSLFTALSQHPCIYRPRKKEPMYFSYRHNRRASWYRANFPSLFLKAACRLRGKPFRTFEASPNYLFHPLSPQRARAAVPDAKLIVLLREPTARAFSHYQHIVRDGQETLSFEEALEKEDERLVGEYEKILADESYEARAYRFYSYRTRGRYVEQLETWTKHFPREQLLVLQTEAYLRDPQATTDRVLDFLELPRWKDFSHQRQNVGGYRETMKEATRDELRAYFKPHNERLWKWLGEEWDWAKYKSFVIGHRHLSFVINPERPTIALGRYLHYLHRRAAMAVRADDLVVDKAYYTLG